MKEQILILLKDHNCLTGREIGEAVDPINWGNSIHTILQELVFDNKIVRNPLPSKEWATYTWSLK